MILLKGLSDLQLVDEKVILNHLGMKAKEGGQEIVPKCDGRELVATRVGINNRVHSQNQKQEDHGHGDNVGLSRNLSAFSPHGRRAKVHEDCICVPVLSQDLRHFLPEGEKMPDG